MSAATALSVVRDAAGGALFLLGADSGMQAMSSFNSSPWTSENFGADPEKAASSRAYVRESIVTSLALCTVAALVAKSWWPLIGSAAINARFFYVYERALKRGEASGSTNWG